jgi:hypothetical protein
MLQLTGRNTYIFTNYSIGDNRGNFKINLRI